MEHPRQNNLFIAIIIGYKNIFLYFLRILIITGLILGSTFLIVYPLWYSALHYTRIYSYTVAGVLVLGGVLLIMKTIRKNILRKRHMDRPRFFFVKRSLIRILEYSAIFSYFYFFALLVHKHHYAAAAGSLVVFLCATGYLLFSKKNT